jgi:hypothetical protein
MFDNIVNDNPRAVIGGNHPPEPVETTPFDVAAKAVDDIYSETTLWLDGQVINTQPLADGVANLLGEIRKAHKLADDARKAEKAVHEAAIAEVQARYAPLIGDTKAGRGKTILAAEACKAALQPWLDAEDKRLREEARVKREAADRAAAEAAAAMQGAAADNLAEREAAEALYTQAQKATTAANVASRQTAKAGSFGRAAGLRTTYTVSIADEVMAARTYWASSRDEVLAFLVSLAERDVRAGKRAIDGFTITEQKVAV